MNGVQKLIQTMRNLGLPISSKEPKDIDLLYEISKKLATTQSDLSNIIIDLGGIGNHVIREVEVSFGSTPLPQKKFTITDPKVKSTSTINVFKAVKTPSSGRNTDEIFVEQLELSAKPNNGSLVINANVITGNTTGKFILNYTIQ